MKKSIAVLCACVGLLAAAWTHAAPVEVWGSTTCQKRFLEPGAEALKAATGIELTVQGVGTGKGLLALIEGKTALAAASSEMESAVKSALKEAGKAGQDIAIPADLTFHEVARDEIVPIVHKDNPITALTWQQLKDIHTGKVVNWNEVGGPDLAIRVVTSHAGSATRAVFQEEVMKKEPYVAGAKEVPSTRRELQEVSKYKGAIGAVSRGFFEQNPEQTKAVQSDPISRPLALLTVGEPTGDAKKVIDFFRSPEGQKHVQ